MTVAAADFVRLRGEIPGTPYWCFGIHAQQYHHCRHAISEGVRLAGIVKEKPGLTAMLFT